jgi:hypothetical protein
VAGCTDREDTARHWRRRRFVAGFTNREDEDPEELPVIEHRQH